MGIMLEQFFNKRDRMQCHNYELFFREGVDKDVRSAHRFAIARGWLPYT